MWSFGSSGLVNDEEEEDTIEESQLEDMREDAINIFRYHFSETSRKKIVLDEEILADLRQKIFRARPMANCFEKAQRAVYDILNEQYFANFTASQFYHGGLFFFFS